MSGKDTLPSIFSFWHGFFSIGILRKIKNTDSRSTKKVCKTKRGHIWNISVVESLSEASGYVEQISGGNHFLFVSCIGNRSLLFNNKKGQSMQNTPLSLNAHDSSFRAIMQALEQLIQQLQSSHTLSQETFERVLEARYAMYRALWKVIQELESTKRSAQDRKELRSLEALLRNLVERWGNRDGLNESVVDPDLRRIDPEERIGKVPKASWDLYGYTPGAPEVWTEEAPIERPLFMRRPSRPQQKHRLLHIIDRTTLVSVKNKKNENLITLPLKPLNAALYTLILSYAPDPVRLGKETLPKYWNLFKELYGYFSQHSGHYEKFVLPVESRKSHPACWFDLSNKIYKLVSEINAAIRRTEELPEKIKEKLYIHKTGAYRTKRYYIQLPPEQHRLPVELREILKRYLG